MAPGCVVLGAHSLEQISLGSNGEDSKALSMSESTGIESSFLERAMPQLYSVGLRARVIEEVETGASRREAVERYGCLHAGAYAHTTMSRSARTE